MSKDKLEAGPLHPPVPNHVGDAHWGKGGRYVVIDGQRVPADQVHVPVTTALPASSTATSAAVADAESTFKKGK